MRAELAVAVLVLAGPAAAETRAVIAIDSYVAADDDAAAVADVAWSAKVEWRTPARELVVDAVERESLIGGAPRRELHELAYTERVESLSATLGRFRVPGGFWLIADGGALMLRRGAIELGIHGGQRSFTNGRVETVLASHPRLLPLIGGSITRRGDVLVRAAYTYTRDVIVVPGAPALPSQPEQFVDAELIARLGTRGYVVAGATAGTRYLVGAPPNAGEAPEIDTTWLGSQAAYATTDLAVRRWRVSAGVAALRSKVGQATGPAAQVVDGSFVESTVRAGYRTTTLHTDAGYRIRRWSDARLAHRVQVTAGWRPAPWFVEVAAGIDAHVHAPPDSGFVDGARAIYRGAIGYKREGAEVTLGAAATSVISDELAAMPSERGEVRAPFTLGARSFAFLRAFATRGAWFAGVELELDTSGAGFRSLAQIGWSR